ncbi:MAG: trypsin-like peptidase domain-containing protein [Planctomycetes bacterium]|nr:trypsin-like peptidase domain-containing protein [Planctomycetota bacterium]
MRSRPVAAAAALLFGSALSAQGHVNPSVLRAPAESAAGLSPSAGVVARARAAVVHVVVEVDGPRGKFAIERPSSGVLVDASGLVLTWRRLVAEVTGAADKRLFVQLDDAGNSRLPAAIEQIDEATGLALLRVTAPGRPLPCLELGADRPRTGEPLVVVARPEGKDMLAFGGVASAALAAVPLDGRPCAADDLFLTDSRHDERCDGAPVVDLQGRLLGLYAAEHVQRDKSEPSLEELKRPSFGVVVPAGVVRRVFAPALANAGNATLRAAPAAAASPFADAVERIAPAVVSVYAGAGDWPRCGADDPGGVQRRDGLGSGVVLSRQGLVVTNLHVCQGRTPQVRMLDGRTFPARQVKAHPATNLALLQVELPAGVVLAAADCNPDDDAILGETVLAVGNPVGTRVVASAGVVSARRDREGGRIQADANLGNQNGGGAVVDALGRLLGIGDAGAVDAIDMQYAMRGDRVTTETNLSTFVGIARVRKVFAAELRAGAAADEPILAPAAVTPADRARRENALTAMVQKASGAMLNVYVARNVAKVDEDDPFASMKEPELVTLGLGSGVVIDRSGLAISNWHVVADAVRPDGSMKPDHAVTVRVFGGKTCPAKVLSISREDDLSLLQLQLEPGEEAQAVELGDSGALAIGENVAAIGNPHGRANTITFGLVTAKEQGIRVRGRWAKLEHLIETDAAINGGNSGGALLDMHGRLVGINSAGGGTFNNKGYAIAVDHVRQQVLGLLFAAYKLRSPDLGLRVLDDERGVVVMDVDGRGPAAKAGVRSGDRVVALAGVPITWSPGFAMTLLQQPAGVELELRVERNGAAQAFRVAPLPAPIWALIRQAGLACRDFDYAEGPEAVRTAAIAMHRQMTGDPHGEPVRIPTSLVVVEHVFPGEQPEGTDLQPGDFVLACELHRRDNGAPVFVPIEDTTKLRDLFNDREIGSYDGAGFPLWVARAGAVRRVEARARRLFW